MTRSRALLTLLVVGAATAAPAGTAQAGQTLGQDFTPGSVTQCAADFTFYPSLNTAPEPYAAPGPGVITSWTFRTNAGVTGAITGARLKVGVFSSATSARTVAESRAVDLPANMPTTTPTQIPVSGGERIGFYSGGGGDCFGDQAGATVAIFNGDPHVGDTNTYNAGDPNHRFPLSARLEPDADHDGFGDETQDACPTNASTQGACPAKPSNGTPKDVVKPTISGLSFSSTVFAAAKSGPSIAKKAKIGTKVSFTLSEPSSVKFTVDRKTSGRKVGKKCKAKTKGNAKKKACTRWVKVRGSFTVAGKAGKNTFTFRGRIGGKSLKPGPYRLTGTATDPAKNASLPRNKSFRIVP